MQMTLCCATCVGKAANCIYPNKVVVDNAVDMESAVAVDHVCATYMGNRRGNSNFIESDVIPMDIDNDHSDNLADWITEDNDKDGICADLFPAGDQREAFTVLLGV